MIVQGAIVSRAPGRGARFREPARRFGRLPAWARVLLVYAASRVVSTVLIAAMFLLATGLHWKFASYRAHADFFTFSGSWDASFYKRIAELGYPRTLPTDLAGHVLPNPWAFLPVYPGLVRALMDVTGLGFYPAGVLLAAACGAGAALLLHAVLAERTTRTRAFWATAVFCLGPLSFLLQVAYAESLFLLLLFGALLMMVRRHYLMIIPFAVVAAFTRPGILALALALGLHLLVRLSSADRPRARETASIVAAGAVTAGAGLAWPLVAAAVTSRKDAYLATELSWWVGFVGRRRFAPLTPWFAMADRYLGAVGAVLVVLVAAAFAWWLLRRPTRALGSELVGFGGGYALYLFAVFLPQQSTFRLLLPLSPLTASGTFTRTARRRRAILIGAVALQPVAILLLWFLGYP